PAPTPPPTPAPTSPPRTIGSCQQLSLDTVNGWRATLGRPALSSSSSLYNGACSWATHLAETDTHSHAPGVSGEVIAGSSGSCTAALSIWLGSSGHYAVLTSALVTSGGIACVKDSSGNFWAVGRVA
ncbi:MAG: CAP domain-containing protein, partial [Ilumatobacteraceae bacterium]